MTVGGDTRRYTSIGGDSSVATASIIAHELKSPLAVVRQLALELEQGSLTDKEMIRIAEQIRLTSEQAMRLSSNIAKTDRLQAELFPTMSLDSQAVCRDMVIAMQPMYRAYGKSITVRSRNKKSELVVANPDLLKRILANFIDNALHYSDESSVVQLYTQLLKKQDRVRFGVRDVVSKSKTEVDEKNYPHRISMAHDKSGIGLRIAHQFADICGSSIGAIRHRDGTTFYVDVMVSRQLSLV